MPDSSAPRKRAQTEWPEQKARNLTGAERVARHRAKKAGLDPDLVVPKRTRDPHATTPVNEEAAAEIPVDPEEADAEGALDRSARDAVASALAQWGKTQDPLASIALGLAKAFDAAVDAGNAGPAATVAERLVSVLDRLRPASGAGSVPADAGGAPGKATDPADLVARRKERLAQAAKV